MLVKVSRKIIGMEIENDVFNSQGNLPLSVGHVLLERDLAILLNQLL